jgi:hypothetical protein
VSHHFDSAADRADGRINPCDLYAFPAAPGATAVIPTVNPDAGRSSPTTFRPDACYEFVLASDGGTSEDIALRVTFTKPDQLGQQGCRSSAPAAPPPGTAPTGPCWARATPARCSPWPAAGWPGRTGRRSLQRRRHRSRHVPPRSGEGRYNPEVFTAARSNTFAGPDVTAIALQLPDADFGSPRIALWARISLDGHAPQRQVSRIGQAMLRPLFSNPPERRPPIGTPTASGSATSPRPPPASPGCPIPTPTPHGWRRRAGCGSTPTGGTASPTRCGCPRA